MAESIQNNTTPKKQLIKSVFGSRIAWCDVDSISKELNRSFLEEEFEP